MEYTGLLQKYPVNRVLTEEERRLQLKQKQRLDVEPAHQLSVIKMNSAFMEVVDKYYAWKGVLTTAVIALMLVICGMSVALAVTALADNALVSGPSEMSTTAKVANAAGFLLAFGLFPALVGIWLLRKEAFTYTHYPICLNRKARMVHVFRLDGSVLSVPWDNVFFCIGRCHQPRHWEIQGHVLAADGRTVVETFAFSMLGVGDVERELLKRHWEFNRRYMEEGPQSVSGGVRVCLPISERHETFKFGLHRTHFWAGGTSLPLQMMTLLLYVIFYPGRWFALRTSKLPRWPKHIEEACLIEPGDPYVKDARMNPPDLR